MDFSVVNDMHEHDSVLQVLFKDAKGKYDFVCFNGDMTSSIDSTPVIMDNYMRSASRLFASDTPLYLCRGNHECLSGIVAVIDELDSRLNVAVVLVDV